MTEAGKSRGKGRGKRNNLVNSNQTKSHNYKTRTSTLRIQNQSNEGI